MNTERRVESELRGDWLRANIEIPGTKPAEVLAAFYEADRLRQWWGGELISKPLEDGAYIVHFAQLGQTMRGKVTSHVPGELLTFTWAWDHEPDIQGLVVTVRAVPTADGAQLELEHGPYTEATRGEAHGHREGWEYFLPRLVDHLTQADLSTEG